MSKSRTSQTFRPPVMEAARWVSGKSFPADKPLIIVSQAAPVDPPPEPLREHIAEVALNRPEAHLYGPVLGLPALRTEVAQQWSQAYGGSITDQNVGLTSGCNQAFAAVVSSLTNDGDEVILPTPWYFNHKMWLDMQGVIAVPLDTSAEMLPDVTQAEALITERTKAIALVTPNNPAGVEYPGELLSAFYDLAKRHGIALIVDETYRDFDSRSGAPHRLFENSDWSGTLIHLYSFSKAYRLTGHRVGAIIAAPERLDEMEKFLDTVTICPNQLGQHAALWGMQNLSQWLAGEREEILARRAAIEANMPVLEAKGWRLLGLGAYFAYLQHPFDIPSDALAQELVDAAHVLALPGTMFHPEGSERGKQEIRLAFANVTADQIKVLFDRLASYRPKP
ncbi:aminotransferase [Cognatishimia maritima]|uniref:aspartate transaminase n=1 Tax=Cognatishimia maritima TaxID=870908 RepID=A0A1M5J915_9RHOB|nr:aminotransferase [Cognatishimia maritima]SHG36493.1 Aspartate/methionine/tyrosine aminotransferase [Cognatishimia maritima]